MSRLEKLLAMFEADPADADLAYMIAQERVKGGEHALATEWFDRCLSIDGRYLYAYFHKARSQAAIGELASARGTLEAGLDRARAVGDGKAIGEIGEFLAQLPREPG